MFFPCIFIVPLKILAMCPYVHEENGAVKVIFGMFFGNYCLLHGIHAADRGTISMVTLVGIPGPHTLEPCDFSG